MKAIILFFLAASLFLFSCNNPKSSGNDNHNADTTNEEKAAALNYFFKKFEEPSQFFSIPSNKPSEIKGKKGTIIKVTPNDLETVDGKPIQGNIQLELKELTRQSELLSANAQTVADGKLLESGGAYFINFTANNQAVKLKKGKSLSVAFPKLKDSEMSLFYGERNNLGQMNWTKTTEAFKSIAQKPAIDSAKRISAIPAKRVDDVDAIINYINKTDTATETKDEKEQYEKNRKNYQVVRKFYEEIKLESLGWINCDRLIDISDKTDFTVNITNSNNIPSACVSLIFKNINSIMSEYYIPHTKNESVHFNNIPVGYKVRLFAYTVKDGKILAYSSEVTVQKGQTSNISLSPIPEDQFKELMNK